MNKYTISDLIVGNTKEKFEVEITNEFMEMFLKISGDTNPMHIDKEYAINRGFQDKLVYGMLTASFYSTLVGVYLPGEYCILQELSTSFYKPVYVGDKLTVEGKVIDVDKKLNRATISAKVLNHLGKRVSKATIKVGFLNE